MRIRNSGQMRTMCFVGAAIVAAAGSVASADYTAIETPPGGGLPSGEATHANIIQELFGGGWQTASLNPTTPPEFSPGSQQAPLEYTGTFEGSAITITRVRDAGGSTPLNLAHAPGSSNDSIWTDGTVNTRARALYASDNQNFGFVPGGAGSGTGDYQELFQASGSGFNVTGESKNFTIDGDFRWARSREAGTFADGHTSYEGDNDGRDHMVTYHVDIAGRSLPIWLLFWEDRPHTSGGHSDWDFNDLVVMLTVIPLPGPAVLGMVGLFGLAAVRRRRHA